MRNANNEVLRAGCDALGWRGGPLQHNRVGCQQSGFCELGCAYDAKQNALKVVLPQAVEAGAHRLRRRARRSASSHDGARVTGVHAVARRRGTAAREGRWTSGRASSSSREARSGARPSRAAATSPILQAARARPAHASGRRRWRVGSTATSTGWRGIPQSYECTEHLSHEEGSDERVWIVPAFAHPIGAAATLPGFGAAHMAAMRAYPRLAVLTAMVHDETSGEVDVDGDGRSDPALRDERGRPRAAREGARRVRAPPLRGRRARGHDPRDPARARHARRASSTRSTRSVVRPHSVPLTAVHPMGTMRMGEDPKVSVVRSTGEHHQLRGLFVADGSLFPTSLGGAAADQHLRVRAAPRAARHRARARVSRAGRAPRGPHSAIFASIRGSGTSHMSATSA